MTKINRISAHGFKSFAQKTEIPFDSQFNCILGPNGSGKSNIGDAMCFVLGRLSAKSMRAEKAANLIFNGGKSNKPSSNGTVEIAFCNKNKIFPTDAKEVIIGRTITKRGSSIYRVNSKKHTRTEVLDILSHAKVNPDGYNIVLQGDIMRFVDMSPLERRRIIEEISDVSTYEEKKHKAVLELNKVEDKLNNAEIILKERKTYLKELKKDRDQALKFKELKDKIDSNKATCLHHQIKEKSEIKNKHDLEIEKHQQKINLSEQSIKSLKEKIATWRSEINNINQDIEKKGEKEQVKVHREIEDLKVNLTRDKTRVSTLKDEINKIQQRKDQFKVEAKELEEKSKSYTQNQRETQQAIAKKQRDLNETNQNITQFKKKHKIETSQDLDNEIDEKDKLIDQNQEKIQTIRQQQQEMLREKDRVEYQLQTIDERSKKVREVAQENKQQIKVLQQHKTNFKQATLKLNQLLDQDSSFASQLGNARKNLQELQEKHAQLNAKTLTMQAGLASNQAVKSILENKKNLPGVYGTIAELGQVKKQYALALETAAGSRMQNIVVDNDATAAKCIKYLQHNKLGSAAFIPLNKIRTQDITSDNMKLLKQSGVHDFSLNLISYKSEFKKAFSYVFGNSLVVDDINTARSVGIGRIKMSTLDGNMVEASGVMRGGFKGRKSSVGFKEQDSLQHLERLDNEIGEIHGVISNIETQRSASELEISSLRNQRAELEAQVITLEKTLHLDTNDLDASSSQKKELSAKLKEIDQQLISIQKSISSINRDLATLKSSKQMLRTQVNELRNPRLLAQLQAFEESKQKLREEVVRLEGELKTSSAQMTEMIGPEKNKIIEILKQHEKEEQDFGVEIKKLNESIKINDKDLLEKEKASKEFYSKYRSLFNKREKLSNDLNKSESNVEAIREKTRTSERELNLISLKNAEVKAKLAGLNEEFTRYKNATIIKNKPLEEIKQEINRFEVMLGQMSAVNMKALEVYEQVDSEYNKLVEKKSSLHGEKTDVLTLMNEIETKKKEHFMKTFKHANENFSNIFSNLFSKGKAYLQLENPEKPFDDGLSVKVKLTGNRFMDIKSLSGGEKTLTALSFIFAIQEYQPASFYILDEIDAALDKHNSDRLAKLIRNYADRAQYIVISHNDSLISEADSLFGVSMRDGVSKVTSLKI
jgi:chromosome segregation protein